MTLSFYLLIFKEYAKLNMNQKHGWKEEERV